MRRPRREFAELGWTASENCLEAMRGLVRAALAEVAAPISAILAAFVGSWLLRLATGLSRTMAFLLLARAAMTEMVMTAHSMDPDAEIVTAFHLLRNLVACSTILLVYRVYETLRGAQEGSRD